MILDLLTSFSRRVKLDSASMTRRCPLPIPDHPPIPRLPAFSRWLVDLHSPNLCSVIRKEARFHERDLIPPVPEAEARNSLRCLLRDWTEISCTDLVSSDRLIAPSEASAFALAPKARPPARPSPGQLPFAEVLFFRADNATD